jgi:glycosyltransferase involved in cell wall biosynthesis
MRILEINKFYFAKGGADKHFVDLVELLESTGNEVAVFSMRNANNKESRWKKYFVSLVGYTEGYSFKQKLKGIFRMFYSTEAKKKINVLLDKFKPDIVHIHNIYHQMSPSILFEIKKRKIPIVMTVHDYKLISPNHGLFLNGKTYNRCRNGKYYNCFLDKAVKNSYAKSFLAMLEAYWHGKILKTFEKNVDRYIVPSKFAKRILLEEGVDEEKIIVLPHFIKKNKMKEELEISESYALYFGRLTREKGVQDLIKIFDTIDGIRLYLAGEMENNFVTKENDRIKYLGYLDQEQLANYIKNSICVVSGSKLPETFGLTAMEAIANGKPFLGYKSGAFPEIIENGFNGFLAENQARLWNIISKVANGEIKFNSKKIMKQAQIDFDAKKYSQKMIELFEERICLTK